MSYRSALVGLLAMGTSCLTPEEDTDVDRATDADTQVQDTDADTGECWYDPAYQACWRPVTSPRPTWNDTIAPLLEQQACAPYVQCPDAAETRFALVTDYGEYRNARFFTADGSFRASVSNSDEVDSDDPCDCVRAGYSFWQGEPVSDCAVWSDDLFSLPTCPLLGNLLPAEPLTVSGRVTGALTWDETTAFRLAQCAGIATCGSGHTALVRLPAGYDPRQSGQGIDVFDEAGALVGTADAVTRESWGTVPADCQVPTAITVGCQLGP